MKERLSIALTGCTPVPLSGYLKSIGVFRTLATQADTEVRGYWVNESFLLDTVLDSESLLAFFLYKYHPTPIIAPWNGGSGFYAKKTPDFMDRLEQSENPRFTPYGDTITVVRELLQRLGIWEKPKDSVKMDLLMACRSELSDSVVNWLDAVSMLTWDDPKFPPLLGTGGNDGNFEFTLNFMKNLSQVLDFKTGAPNEQSRAQLRAALFGEAAQGMEKSAIGQFAPGQAGGPNSTSGFAGAFLINAWDFVLMMEGAVAFAAAATRKNERTRSAVMSYPFTVMAEGAGNGSTSATDETTDQSRAEMWMPLWQQPTSYAEIAGVFREGRIQIKRAPKKHQRAYRPVSNGVDFSRACATLAVDRGIDGFQRYAFMKRAGKSYFAVPLTRFQVQRHPEANLLSDIDGWVQDVERFTNQSEVGSFKQALRQIKSRMFDLAEFGGRKRVQDLMVDLAHIEQLCVNNVRARETIRPLVLTKEDWLHQADDGSDAWNIALGVASLYQTAGVLPLRAYFSPVHAEKPWAWAKEDKPPSVVWGIGDTVSAMARVLERRALDWRKGNKHKAIGEQERGGTRDSLGRTDKFTDKPFDGTAGVTLEHVHAFLFGSSSLRNRVGELIWALLPFTTGGTIYRYVQSRYKNQTLQPVKRRRHVPFAYAVSRLVVSSHLQNSKADAHEVPIPGPLLQLLTSNRLEQAAQVAEQRLAGSGYPLAFRGIGKTTASGREIAASLLIPLRRSSIAALQDSLFYQTEDVKS